MKSSPFLIFDKIVVFKLLILHLLNLSEQLDISCGFVLDLVVGIHMFVPIHLAAHFP